jgi:hypothetical protein
MRDISKDIEQLEIAGDLIDKNSPTTSRLALFLVDNLIELIMHKRALYEFRNDEQWGIYKPSKYSIKKKSAVKNYFNDKINFLVNDIKLINDSDSRVFKFGHYLRNESYHNGIVREKIINIVTRIYFKTVCIVFPLLWIGSYGYSRQGEVRDFLSKYNIDAEFITNDILREICKEIFKKRDSQEFELAQALSEDLLERVQEVLDLIDYLSSEPGSMSPDEGLKWMQFREAGILEFGVVESHEEYRLFWEKVKKELAAFKPSVTLDKLNKWLIKADGIKQERDKGIILQKFWEIDKPLLIIENLVHEAAFEYDEEINRRIDESLLHK